LVPIKNANKANAQRIGEAIKTHAAANGGRIDADKMADEARDPKHPMHRHLEWDDAAAARAFRVDQVREIIRIVLERDASDKKSTWRRAFVNINDHGRSYRTVAEVLENADLQMLLMKQAERELAAFQERYDDLSDICSIVAKARSALKARIAAGSSKKSRSKKQSSQEEEARI
jgi:hypothetical protein